MFGNCQRPVVPFPGSAGRPSCFACRPFAATPSSTAPQLLPVTLKLRPCHPPWLYPERWKGSLSSRQNFRPARAPPAVPESFVQVVQGLIAQNPTSRSFPAATPALRAPAHSQAVRRAFCRPPPSAFAGFASLRLSQPFFSNPRPQYSNS